MSIRVSLRGGFTRIRSQIEEGGVRAVRKKTKELYEYLIDLSPVDTGSYRASWTVSLNKMASGYVEGGSSEAPLPPPKFIFPASYVLGDKIVIGNRTPYAQQLENGWSQQAPLGVVKVAMANMTFK